MVRLPRLQRLLRRDPARPRRRPAPPAGELRRERRALLRLREQKLRDLGGLSLEMYRRDRFREDLVLERCAELCLAPPPKDWEGVYEATTKK